MIFNISLIFLFNSWLPLLHSFVVLRTTGHHWLTVEAPTKNQILSPLGFEVSWTSYYYFDLAALCRVMKEGIT